MRKGQPGYEPEYIRKREERAAENRAADRSKAIISQITRSIDGAHHAEVGRYYQAERHEDAKRRRELWTIFVLFMTALVGYCGIKQVHVDSDKALMNVQRAFVVPAPLDISEMRSDDHAPYAWKIAIAFENGGNTAAMQLRSRIMRIYHDNSVSRWIKGIEPDEFEYEFDGLPPAAISLAPKERFIFPPLVVKNNAIRMLKNDLLSFFIFGEAEYADVFDVPHRTKFCFKMLGHTIGPLDNEMGRGGTLGEPALSRRLETVTTSLVSRLCRRNNCADADCGPPRKRPDKDRPNLNVLYK